MELDRHGLNDFNMHYKNSYATHPEHGVVLLGEVVDIDNLKVLAERFDEDLGEYKQTEVYIPDLDRLYVSGYSVYLGDVYYLQPNGARYYKKSLSGRTINLKRLRTRVTSSYIEVPEYRVSANLSIIHPLYKSGFKRWAKVPINSHETEYEFIYHYRGRVIGPGIGNEVFIRRGYEYLRECVEESGLTVRSYDVE